jgi:hypothetical protein
VRVEKSLQPSDVQEVDVDLSFQRPTLIAVDQCKICGTLWRLFSDDTYSLVPEMSAKECCDNTMMDVIRVYPRTGSTLFNDEELSLLIGGGL